VSCEEFGRGSVFQVDPFGLRPPQETTLGMMRTGAYESFASDIRNEEQPRFFVTEDAEGGAMRRFTPDDPTWDDPWNILHTNGTIDYLVLNPEDEKGGTYTWTTDFQAARTSATLYYQHTEGIDVSGNELFVVSKNQKELFILDLDAMTYQVHSTISGVFDGMPDQMQRLVHGSYDLLYFCEEGGPENGVHARDTNGWFFTILESAELNDETTGLDFSPDGKHLYVSFQENGLIFDISREDGLPFHGKTLDVKYHELQIQ
jgi:secreted PhoX family phosphatase